MPVLPDLTETIVAIVTPPGKGAIAVVRLSGPQALAIADAVFRGKRPSEQPSHTVRVGRIQDEEGHILDEAVVTVFRAPRSYTGEDVVEFSLHGSPYVQQAVVELLLRRGARLATPGEFTLRAFLNGKIDLTQAEAVADLISSQTSAAHAAVICQLRGGFKSDIAHLRDELIHFASLIELEARLCRGGCRICKSNSATSAHRKDPRTYCCPIALFPIGQCIAPRRVHCYCRSSQRRQKHAAQCFAQRGARHRVRYCRHYARYY